jgi:hypothetical protein
MGGPGKIVARTDKPKMKMGSSNSSTYTNSACTRADMSLVCLLSYLFRLAAVGDIVF